VHHDYHVYSLIDYIVVIHQCTIQQENGWKKEKRNQIFKEEEKAELAWKIIGNFVVV
jgi:hypothetical protein